MQKKINTGYFTAIDFETADKFNRLSVCEIGLAIVEDYKIIDTISLLVRPPQNHYDEGNIKIHGITPDMTEHADDFSEVYEEIKHYLIDRDVVAHNVAFDLSCLYNCLLSRGIEQPISTWHCTFKLFGHGLKSCCDKYGIKLDNHHRADSDAIACAELMILYLKQMKA